MVRWGVQQTVLAEARKELEVVEACKPEGEEKGRLTAVREVVEEKGGKIEEWNEEDEMGNIDDPMGEL